MNTELFLQCLVACLVGNAAHIAFKIYSLSKDYKKANMAFTLGQYFADDKWALVADLVGSAALVYLADEWIDNPYVLGKIKTLFVLIGFTGSYVILYFASNAKRKFQKVIDEKTNKADGINLN